MQIKNILFTVLCLTVATNISAHADCIPTGTSCSACTTYRCNTGYFGTGTNCTSCAAATGNSNATSAIGSTSITNCYIPNGTPGSDASGGWTISGGNCSYTQ